MANLYRGEVAVSVAGLAYTLRPTFHILCKIEERLGLTLPQLRRRVEEKGLLASEILMVLAIATHHDGSRPFDPEMFLNMPADQVALHPVMPALAKFLSGAAGAQDYALLLEVAYRRLRLEPRSFWALTMPELRVLLREPRRAQPDGDVGELMRQFPDIRA